MSCPKCHGNHRGWEPCILKVGAMPSPLDQAAEFIANLSPKRGSSHGSSRHGKYKNEAARKEYMRDYMAKRRGNHVS